MVKQDSLEVYLNDDSRKILFSLVDRLNWEGPASDSNDVFEPTLSAIFLLFDELMQQHTPDLYQSEWSMIYKALSSSSGLKRIPSSIERIRANLVLQLEDLGNDSIYLIDGFELSKKIAGFSDVCLCAIFYHVQKALVSARRNQAYEFPEIKFKG